MSTQTCLLSKQTLSSESGHQTNQFPLQPFILQITTGRAILGARRFTAVCVRAASFQIFSPPCFVATGGGDGVSLGWWRGQPGVVTGSARGGIGCSVDSLLTGAAFCPAFTHKILANTYWFLCRLHHNISHPLPVSQQYLGIDEAVRFSCMCSRGRLLLSLICMKD